MALPVMLIVIACLVWVIYTDYKIAAVSYLTFFIHSGFVFMVWNLFDLLVMDWLVFCTIQPRFMRIPGTEDNPAYSDYKYHFIGFLKGIVLSAIGAGIVSLIVFILRLGA
jgi:hypothetical protein